MADVYKRLAKKLDRLPHGFPATDSGVEIRILEKIFTPGDARIALKLGPIPAPAGRIAKRLSVPVDVARATLDRMAARGQILSLTHDGVQHYALAPFVIGIYEFQLERLDKELADLFEAYAPHLLKELGGHAPALSRVVPINASIDARLQILAYEDMRAIIRGARSFALRECICRKERALQGQPCSHTLETCLAFSSQEGAFDYFNYAGRLISQDEALRLLDATEQEGLVHATYNVREQPMFVCNCCSCCCGFLRGLQEFGAPHMIARSNFVAAIDQDTCNDCAACASPRCPMDAIVQEPGRYAVSADRCIGCGVCAVVCPSDSIRLTRRPDAEQAVPPRDIVHWSVERASSRSGPLTRLALRLWLARHEARAARRAAMSH
jgi:Pyruvate/2-oxoacid:ferredoxin oxidoreductase delta subunit